LVNVNNHNKSVGCVQTHITWLQGPGCLNTHTYNKEITCGSKTNDKYNLKSLCAVETY